MTDLNEGPRFSPDGGKFWQRGGKMYWEDGDVTNAYEPGCIYRQMPLSVGSCEDYSQWSEEKRAAVQAKWAESRRVREQNKLLRQQRITALRDSARQKLTPDEIEACNLDDE